MNTLSDGSKLDFDINKLMFGEEHYDPNAQCDIHTPSALLRLINFSFDYLSIDEIKASFKVNEAVSRYTPHGLILNGGSSLIIAESIAGLHSMLSCYPRFNPLGSNIEAHHLAPAFLGDKIIVVSKALKLGRSQHLIEVNLYTEKKHISTIRVVNVLVNN